MKAFACRTCGERLFFENSVCLSCGSALAFSRMERAIVPVDPQGRYVDADGLVWWVCSNLGLSGCTWLTRIEGEQCFSCQLTQTRPSDDDVAGLQNLRQAEQAKRHLILELDTLGLPITTKAEDPQNGLAFNLLSSATADVTIGHVNGLITIDLAESDDAHREKVRAQLAEPYRTMLGHFRHEIGHYYQRQLVRGSERTTRFRELFGDETSSYEGALERYYSQGAPGGWESSHISTYATMHPFEDFAETWAHYLHICDTLESAAEHGLMPVAPPMAFTSFRDVVTGVWFPLSMALNVINRSMGRDDLYPFVIPEPVLDKLEFVATLRQSLDPNG